MLRRVTQLTVSRGLAVSQTRLQERELIVEKLTGDDEGIYVWGLNRPKSKNALGKNIFKEILEAFEEIRVSCFCIKNVR